MSTVSASARRRRPASRQLQLLMTDPPESRPTVQPAAPPALSPVDSAFELGYSFAGTAEVVDPPMAYTPEEAAAFRAGVKLGKAAGAAFRDVPADASHYADAGHWPAWTDLRVSLPSDADARTVAEMNGDDHDAQPDPNAVECWAQTPADYFDAEAEFDAQRHEPEEWSERAEVLGHRVHAVAEGGAR